VAKKVSRIEKKGGAEALFYAHVSEGKRKAGCLLKKPAEEEKKKREGKERKKNPAFPLTKKRRGVRIEALPLCSRKPLPLSISLKKGGGGERETDNSKSKEKKGVPHTSCFFEGKADRPFFREETSTTSGREREEERGRNCCPFDALGREKHRPRSLYSGGGGGKLRV